MVLEKTWNKRPMGHIAHLRKQFKSIDTYDYIITLIKRWKKTFLTLLEFIGSSFEETWIPFTQGCLVPSLVEIGPLVLEKKMKMWEVYRQTDGQTDDGWQVIRKAHLSFQLRWAKNEKFKDKHTDNGLISKAHLSYQLRWAQKKTLIIVSIFVLCIQVAPLLNTLLRQQIWK